MSDSNGQMLIESLMRDAVKLFAESHVERLRIRENSKTDCGNLLDAHMLITGLITNGLARQNLTPGKADESTSGRLTLLASFVQGIDVCEVTISEGRYAQAANLLKQELETIVAMVEFSKNLRADGRTPNVSNALWGVGGLYGLLNKAAHVSDRELLSHLYGAEPQEGKEPVSILPIYNKDVARRLYSLHVALLIQLAIVQLELYSEMYGYSPTPEESMIIVRGVEILQEEGFLSKDETVK